MISHHAFYNYILRGVEKLSSHAILENVETSTSDVCHLEQAKTVHYNLPSEVTTRGQAISQLALHF